MEIIAQYPGCCGTAMHDEAGRASGAGNLTKHCTARAKRQLSKSTGMVSQTTKVVRAILGERCFRREAVVHPACKWKDDQFGIRLGEGVLGRSPRKPSHQC